MVRTDGLTDVHNPAAIINEAIQAFQLNSALFTVLDPGPPTTKRTLPLLGNPISEDESGDSGEDASDSKDSEPESGSQMVSVASVAVVIAAVCIAHFLIVVGGLTGKRGYAKLQALEQWLQTIWGP